MKKTVKLIALVFAIGLAFTACKKDAQVEQLQNVQQTHELGLNFLPADEYAALPVAETPSILKALPTSVSLPNSPVGNQGGEGSCVAWGTTYAGRSAMWVKDHPGTFSQSVNIFSPEYVYNQIKVRKSCGSGAYVKTGLDLLKSQGACRWSLMPYTDVSCSTMPNATQKTDAAGYKISSYGTVSINVTAIKTQLSLGNPVIVGGPVDNNFMYLANNAVLKARSGSLGGHCYCLVGYDDAKNAFKFQNSWGTGWASSGFGWIDYGYITQWWTEVYAMTN